MMQALKRITAVRSHSRGTVTLSYLWEDAFQQAKAPFVRGDEVKREDYDMWRWLRKSADDHDVRLEMIDSQARKYSSPSAQHQFCSLAISANYRNLKGWCILPAVDIWYDADNIPYHDVSGWQTPIDMRAIVKSCQQTAITIKPHWAVEIISPNSRYDDHPRKRSQTKEVISGKITRKFDLCARSGVAHYWLVDPIKGTILVYKHNNPAGSGTYELVQSCKWSEGSIILEPFEAELHLPSVFSLHK